MVYTDYKITSTPWLNSENGNYITRLREHSIALRPVIERSVLGKCHSIVSPSSLVPEIGTGLAHEERCS